MPRATAYSSSTIRMEALIGRDATTAPRPLRLRTRSERFKQSGVRIRLPMSRPTISVQPRSVHGKEVSKLRKAGTLPAVVYGAGIESQSVAVDAREFELLRRHAGHNAVVDLQL